MNKDNVAMSHFIKKLYSSVHREHLELVSEGYWNTFVTAVSLSHYSYTHWQNN